MGGGKANLEPAGTSLSTWLQAYRVSLDRKLSVQRNDMSITKKLIPLNIENPITFLFTHMFWSCFSYQLDLGFLLWFIGSHRG